MVPFSEYFIQSTQFLTVKYIVAMYDSNIHKHEEVTATLRWCGRWVQVAITVLNFAKEVSNLLPNKATA